MKLTATLLWVEEQVTTNANTNQTQIKYNNKDHVWLTAWMPPETGRALQGALFGPSRQDRDDAGGAAPA